MPGIICMTLPIGPSACTWSIWAMKSPSVKRGRGAGQNCEKKPFRPIAASPLPLLVPVLRRLPAALLGLDHRPAGHAEVAELAGHERLHELHLAHHAHAADGAHHVAAHLELLHELPDLVQLDARAAGDA